MVPPAELGTSQNPAITANTSRRGSYHFGRQGIRKRLYRFFMVEQKEAPTGALSGKQRKRKKRRRSKWSRGDVTKGKSSHISENKQCYSTDSLIDITNDDCVDTVIIQSEVRFIYPSVQCSILKVKRGRGRPKKKKQISVTAVKSTKFVLHDSNTEIRNSPEKCIEVSVTGNVVDKEENNEASANSAPLKMCTDSTGNVSVQKNVDTSEALSSTGTVESLLEVGDIPESEDKPGDAEKSQKINEYSSERMSGSKPPWVRVKKSTMSDNKENEKDEDCNGTQQPLTLKNLAIRTIDLINKTEQVETDISIESVLADQLSIDVTSNSGIPSVMTTLFRSPRVPFHLDDDAEAIPVKSPDGAIMTRKRVNSGPDKPDAPINKKQFMVESDLIPLKFLGPRCKGLKANARKSIKRARSLEAAIPVKRTMSPEYTSDSSLDAHPEDSKHTKKVRNRKKKWFVLTQGDQLGKLILRKGDANDERRHSIDVMESQNVRKVVLNKNIKMYGTIEEMMKQCQLCFVKIPDIMQCLNISNHDASFTQDSSPLKTTPEASSQNMHSTPEKLDANNVTCAFRESKTWATLPDTPSPTPSPVDRMKLKIPPCTTAYTDNVTPESESATSGGYTVIDSVPSLKDIISIYTCNSCSFTSFSLDIIHNHVITHIDHVDTTTISLETIHSHYVEGKVPRPSNQFSPSVPGEATAMKVSPKTREKMGEALPVRVQRPRIPSMPICNPLHAFYQCSHCTYAANNQVQVREHVLSQHRVELNYSCPHCEKRQDELLQKGAITKKSLTLYKQVIFICLCVCHYL